MDSDGIKSALAYTDLFIIFNKNPNICCQIIAVSNTSFTNNTGFDKDRRRQVPVH